MLQTYSFTKEDIDLITFSLRRLSENTASLGLKNDAVDLLAYIERMKEELKTTTPCK